MQTNFCRLQGDLLRKGKNVTIRGYRTYSKNRNNRKGGGICILAEESWSAKSVEVKDEKLDEEEILIVKVHKGKCPINIMTTYGKQEKGEAEAKEDIVRQIDMWEQTIVEMQQKNEQILWIVDLIVKVGSDGQRIKGNHAEITCGGRRIRQLIKRRNLHLINATEKCTGLWTQKEKMNDRYWTM